MTNIINIVLEKIKEKNIKPRPRWIFVFYNIFLWVLVPIFIIFGALSFSFIIHMFISSDFDLRDRVSGNLFEFVFKTMPYFWIIILIIFLFILYFDFKNTKKSYKFNFLKVSLFGLSLIILIGIMFYFSGVARYFDNNFLKVNSYKALSCQNLKMWNNPEKGILVGKFINISENSGSFKDIYEKNWNILFNNDAELESLNLDNNIKVVGRKIDDNNFYAEHIREMRCGCGMKNCDCVNSERNFIDKRSNGCGIKILN
ncbi:MAG TPA: hypothetical protein PKL13_02785 [bacterium]|nr:hypothetical protein [bacterium]